VSESDAGVAAIVLLTNRIEQSVPAVIHSTHNDDEDTIYAPAWILAELLHDTEDVRVTRHMPSLGTRITVLPHTSDHLRSDADPQILLRDGFEQYTCLIRGLDYQIWLGEHAFTITLTDVHPPGNDIICIRGNELELELLAPLDRPPTPLPAPEPPAPEPPAPPPAPPPTPQPPTQTQEERRATIAAATRRRLAALSQAPSTI
jgi:hypothetical protein